MKRAFAFASALGASLSLAGSAEAIERQHHLGLGPSLSMLSVSEKSTMSVGAGLALHYTYGLDDQFNLMVEASSSIVAKNQQQDTPETPRTRPAGVDHGAVGVGYVIDILRWVPYIGVLGGVYRLHGGTLPEALFLPGLEVGAGLDYQLSRKWAVGAAFRQHLLLSKMDTYPSYSTALLRFEYMWGY
jgi:opacity protein-like surface antigen